MRKNINMLVGFMVIVCMLTSICGAAGQAVVKANDTKATHQYVVIHKIKVVEKIVKVPIHVKVPVFVELVKPAKVEPIGSLALMMDNQVKNVKLATGQHFKERVVCQVVNGVKHFSNEFMAVANV